MTEDNTQVTPGAKRPDIYPPNTAEESPNTNAGVARCLRPFLKSTSTAHREYHLEKFEFGPFVHCEGVIWEDYEEAHADLAEKLGKGLNQFFSIVHSLIQSRNDAEQQAAANSRSDAGQQGFY